MLFPIFVQTPMQKSPSCGGRAEFISSVPSLCQVTKELSIGVPSGGPISLPWAVNVTCHMPTIGSFSAPSILKSEPDWNTSEPCHDCRCRIAPNLFASPHAALAEAPSRQTETKANAIIFAFKLRYINGVSLGQLAGAEC